MKPHRLITNLLLMLFALGSCKPKAPVYDNEKLFTNFLHKYTHLKVDSGKSVLIILQNTDCICTEANMKFTLDVFRDDKYADYKKYLMVLVPNHKILSRLNGIKVKVEMVNRDSLYYHGMPITSDKIFLYDSGKIDNYDDMHNTPDKELRNIYL